MIFFGKSIFLLLIFINLLTFENAYSKKKICDIKFNVKEDVKELEKKVNLQSQKKSFPKNYTFYCYQIGLEHDTNQKPISEKPIYACCRD